jgi:nucleoside-diphosphate-sugar epimerase
MTLCNLLDELRVEYSDFCTYSDEPVDYAAVANHLARTRGLPAKEVRGPYHSNWMDNSRAKAELGWRPSYDLEALIESAWTYQRSAEEPRKVWYPG